jgi:hypothetical protein
MNAHWQATKDKRSVSPTSTDEGREVERLTASEQRQEKEEKFQDSGLGPEGRQTQLRKSLENTAEQGLASNLCPGPVD